MTITLKQYLDDPALAERLHAAARRDRSVRMAALFRRLLKKHDARVSDAIGADLCLKG